MSSIVGPTIKADSRLSAYLPEIGQKGGEIRDVGLNEPILHMDGVREIDGIHFWSDAS